MALPRIGARAISPRIGSASGTDGGEIARAAWAASYTHPCDQRRPEASNVNFVNGETVPNLLLAKLDAAGRACIFRDATIHVLADVTGYVR